MRYREVLHCVRCFVDVNVPLLHRWLVLPGDRYVGRDGMCALKLLPHGLLGFHSVPLV